MRVIRIQGVRDSSEMPKNYEEREQGIQNP